MELLFLYHLFGPNRHEGFMMIYMFFSSNSLLDLAAMENSDFFLLQPNQDSIFTKLAGRCTFDKVLVTVSFLSFGLILLFDCYCQKRQKQYG